MYIQVDCFETLCLRVGLHVVAAVQGENVANRTVDKSVCCAVTLFGDMCVQRNAGCLSDSALVYLDKQIGIMTDNCHR